MSCWERERNIDDGSDGVKNIASNCSVISVQNKYASKYYEGSTFSGLGEGQNSF